MSDRIMALIQFAYAVPYRTLERYYARQHGERKVRWHG